MSIQVNDSDYIGTTRNVNKYKHVLIMADYETVSIADGEAVILGTQFIGESTLSTMDATWAMSTAYATEYQSDDPGGVVFVRVNDPKGKFEIVDTFAVGKAVKESAHIKNWVDEADPSAVKSALLMRNTSDDKWTVDLDSGEAKRPKKVVSKAPAKKAAAKKSPGGAAAKKKAAAKKPSSKAPAKAAAKKATTKRAPAKKAAAKRAASKKTATTSSYVSRTAGVRKRIAAKRSK